MEVKQIRKKIIIFTDLDETLLKENKYYHYILNNFIKTLLKKEYEIIPVTSKAYLEVINIHFLDIYLYFIYIKNNFKLI